VPLREHAAKAQVPQRTVVPLLEADQRIPVRHVVGEALEDLPAGHIGPAAAHQLGDRSPRRRGGRGRSPRPLLAGQQRPVAVQPERRSVRPGRDHQRALVEVRVRGAGGELRDAAAEHRQVGLVRFPALLLGIPDDPAGVDPLLQSGGLDRGLRIGGSGARGRAIISARAVHQRLPGGRHACEQPSARVGNTGTGQPFDVPLHHQRLVDQMAGGVRILQEVVGIPGVDQCPDP
jgi:hypothetical protein